MIEEQKRSNWHRPVVGPQQPGASKQVAVFGKSSELAYQRRSEARLVTWACVVCGKTTTDYRYPGFKPRYCGDACHNQAVEKRNEKRNEERVRKQREKRQRAREAKQATTGGQS